MTNRFSEPERFALDQVRQALAALEPLRGERRTNADTAIVKLQDAMAELEDAIRTLSNGTNFS